MSPQRRKRVTRSPAGRLQARPRVRAGLSPHAALAAANVILHSFEAAVAPRYTAEGAEVFRRYVAPTALLARQGRRYVFLCAYQAGRLAGVAALKDACHIDLFFVTPALQRRGIGRCLLRAAAALARKQRPRLKLLTVNASPNALGGYRVLGFTKTGAARTISGITFTPMALPIDTLAPPRGRDRLHPAGPGTTASRRSRRNLRAAGSR